MAGQSHIPQQQAFKYNAFISYARAADDHLAPAVRSALHQFARPWYKLRALRVFLDKAGLPVSPGLSNAIEKALNESKWLLLMASPDAAESEWVRHEIDWWLKHRPCSHLLILLTAGDIVWDPVRNDFDWEHTTALPKTLSGRFADEPLYADLRKLKKTKHLSLRSLAFRDSIASIAATLHDRPKDELDGEDVILHRQFIRIRRIVVTAMSVLTIGVILLTGLSYLQRDRAIQNQINALVNSAGNALAANMQLEALIAGVTAGRLLEKMGRGLDGVIQSVIDSDSWAETHARTAARLHRVLSALHERNRLEGHSAKVNAIAYSPRCPNPAQFIVSGGKDGKVMIWKPNGILKKTLEHGDEVRSVAISPDCRIIASGGRDNTIKLWTRDGVLIEALPNDAWINTLSF
ncbi:MAG: TIR domain-containing protein, partial [Pseudomonadota bacterium]